MSVDKFNKQECKNYHIHSNSQKIDGKRNFSDHRNLNLKKKLRYWNGIVVFLFLKMEWLRIYLKRTLYLTLDILFDLVYCVAVTTKCIQAELLSLGEDLRGAFFVSKRFQLRKCGHDTPKPAAECITSFIGVCVCVCVCVHHVCSCHLHVFHYFRSQQ